MKKHIVVGATAAVVGLTSIAGLGIASAATSTTNGADSLVDKIAQKFNLNKDEVKAVFDEDRSVREAEMKSKEAECLAQAVTDGKLTQEQADKIAAKRQELQAQREAKRESAEVLTEEQRKATMDQERKDLEQWARDNDVPLEYLRGPGGRGGSGHGRPMDAAPAN